MLVTVFFPCQRFHFCLCFTMWKLLNMVLYMQKLYDCKALINQCWLPESDSLQEIIWWSLYLMIFKVAKSLTRFDWYYYGNHDSLQAMSWIQCSLQTQVFHALETRAGNLSVSAGYMYMYVIEYMYLTQ